MLLSIMRNTTQEFLLEQERPRLNLGLYFFEEFRRVDDETLVRSFTSGTVPCHSWIERISSSKSLPITMPLPTNILWTPSATRQSLLHSHASSGSTTQVCLPRLPLICFSKNCHCLPPKYRPLGLRG